jgi:hypothetical protein
MMRYCLASLLILLLSSVDTRCQDRPTAHVAFCQFDIGPGWKQAHATFLIGYTFEVDGKGKLTKISPALEDRWVGKQKVSACLSSWEFLGVSAGTKGSAFFQWKHAAGWQWVQVSLPQWSQTVTIQGDPFADRGTSSPR